MAQTSLIIGDTNWAVKEDSLLGYNVIQNNYLPIPIDCVRATTATRVNEQGLIEVVPRNLLSYSEQFDNNSFWIKQLGCSVTPNTTIAPNGTLTADTLSILSGQYLYQNISAIASTIYTISIYVKVASGTKQFKFNTYSGTGNDFTSSPFTVTTEWQRFTYSFTAISNGTTGIYPILVDGLTGGDFYVWGAQVEAFATATEYFPTTNRLDIPRIDYSTGTASLLVETQRTNVLTYSNDFTNAVWTKSNSTIVANSIISPNGTQNASKIVENSANDQHRIFQSYGGTNNVFSFYAKAGERSWVCVLGSINYTFFNVSNGTIGTIEPGTVPTITSVGNGWYRCTLYNYHPSFALIGIANGNNIPSYQGNGTSGLYVWGAQVEQASYATSYIPTIASSVTRNADLISRTGIRGLIGQTEGTMFAELNITNLLGINGSRILGLDNGVDVIQITTPGVVNANVIRFQVFISGAFPYLFDYTIPSIGVYKMAFTYKQNDFKVYVNGVLVSTGVTGNIPSNLSNLSAIETVVHAIKSLQLYKTQLTNAECIALTTI